MRRAGVGLLAAVLAVSLAAGYRILRPGQPPAARTGTWTAAGDVPTDWGLSFGEAGEAPAGNATAEELAAYDAYYLGATGKKVLYLTFDAGYENGYTPAILDVLKKEQVPAAFFVVGTYIRENPELIRRMAAEGHIVGNHTMDHPDMSAIRDEADFADQLEQTAALYQEATGKEMPRFYRPPQGKFSRSNLQMAKALGYRTVFWSLAYVDWYADRQPTREEALEKLLPRTHNGAILLLHATSKTNAKVLEELITRWKEAGYTFRPLTELGGGDVPEKQTKKTGGQA